MNCEICVQLRANEQQTQALERLQARFSEACSCIGEVVSEMRCWNRVTLHHLLYHKLRQQFPELGSQMVCNAIYSASRAARLIFQNPASPWSIERRQPEKLPKLMFTTSAPVYFDRHTLSVRAGAVSMFTLDGRMRFDVRLSSDEERLFREEKLKEIVLQRGGEGFVLRFFFSTEQSLRGVAQEVPDYLLVSAPDAPESRAIGGV